jgi:hypothetical protein
MFNSTLSSMSRRLFAQQAAQPLNLVLAQRDACKDQSLLPLSGRKLASGRSGPASVGFTFHRSRLSDSSYSSSPGFRHRLCR